jgi:hypothetical protein
MGRGFAYQYPHHVIFDDTNFRNGDVEMFKEEFARSFHAWYLDNRKTRGREGYLFAGNDKMYLGIDYSGELPCMFLEAKEFLLLDKRYRLDRLARQRCW